MWYYLASAGMLACCALLRCAVLRAAQFARGWVQVVAASRRDAKNALHPVRFGGGALFSDGSVEVTWQSKALEYGSTAGVFTKLLHSIESKVDAGLEVKLLVQVRAWFPSAWSQLLVS